MVGLAPPPAAGRVQRVASVEGLATLLVALLTVMALAGVAVAAVLLDRARVLGDPDATSFDVIDVARRGARAKRLYELGVLATGVVWIRWQVHYVRNVQALGRPTGFEPGWAMGGWLIPGVNLIIPPRQLAVSARSSDPSDSPSTPRVLYAWWAAWVATGVLFAIGRLARPPEHEFARSRFGDFQVADRLHAACMAASVVAAVFGILTVFVCTKRQEQLLATAGATRSLRLGMADFPPPPPPGGYPPQPPQPGGWAAPPPAGGFPPQPAWQAPPAPGAYGAPPAYATAGYGYGYGAPPAMKALGGLATALTILLAIMALIDLGAAAAFFDRASLLDDASASIFDISDADDRVAGAGGIQILGLIATGIVWVIWQFRFVKNVHALGRPTGFGPGFAIGGWFIPIANWFIPEQQLAASAKSSDPAPGGSPSTPGVLYGWWATWVVSTLLVAAASVTRPADDELFSSTTLEDFQSADRMQGLGLAIGAVAAILAILTARTCTKRQQQLIAQLSSGTATGQPAYPQPAYPQPSYGQPPYQQPAYPPQAPPPYQPPQPPPYQPPPPYQQPPDQPPPTTF